MRRFYAYIASECTLYSVTPVTLQYYEESDRGHTKTAKKTTKSMNSHQKKHQVKSPLFIL